MNTFKYKDQSLTNMLDDSIKFFLKTLMKLENSHLTGIWSFINKDENIL